MWKDRRTQSGCLTTHRDGKPIALYYMIYKKCNETICWTLTNERTNHQTECRKTKSRQKDGAQTRCLNIPNKDRIWGFRHCTWHRFWSQGLEMDGSAVQHFFLPLNFFQVKHKYQIWHSDCGTHLQRPCHCERSQIRQQSQSCLASKIMQLELHTEATLALGHH